MKKCGTCQKDRPLSGYGRNRCTKDGLQFRCRICRAAFYQLHKKKIDAQKKGYTESPAGRKVQRGCSRRKRLAYPEKYAAVHAVNLAVRIGKLDRPNVCEDCGERTFTEAHHEDYSQQLDVKWLCLKCHRKLHKNLVLV